jgi:2-polyprenyl-3-methyl-5-hydroxy-6-metoxy-1,4-benzoquinol methylase
VSRPAPERVLIDDPNEAGGLHIEDLERYRFAARRVAGLRVVDVACGSGYGSRILAGAGARFTLGIDRARAAMAAAKKFALPGRLQFVQASGDRLPLGAASVDLVVSIETFEHVREPGALLHEIRRVLKPGGQAVISTPLNESEGRLHPENPAHVREYSAAEFAAAVGEHFRKVEMWSQVTQYRDDLVPPALERAAPIAWARRVVKALLPARARELLRAGLGSRGLHAHATRVEPGLNPAAAVQIAVCS